MATVTMTIEEYEALIAMVRADSPVVARMMETTATIDEPKPKKRKRSKYSKELGKQLKMLKKKHPRTAVTKLMKRAHSLTRKALK